MIPQIPDNNFISPHPFPSSCGNRNLERTFGFGWKMIRMNGKNNNSTQICSMSSAKSSVDLENGLRNPTCHMLSGRAQIRLNLFNLKACPPPTNHSISLFEHCILYTARMSKVAKAKFNTSPKMIN